jgi:hypothetical protein
VEVEGSRQAVGRDHLAPLEVLVGRLLGVLRRDLGAELLDLGAQGGLGALEHGGAVLAQVRGPVRVGLVAQHRGGELADRAIEIGQDALDVVGHLRARVRLDELLLVLDDLAEQLALLLRIALAEGQVLVEVELGCDRAQRGLTAGAALLQGAEHELRQVRVAGAGEGACELDVVLAEDALVRLGLGAEEAEGEENRGMHALG